MDYIFVFIYFLTFYGAAHKSCYEWVADTFSVAQIDMVLDVEHSQILYANIGNKTRFVTGTVSTAFPFQIRPLMHILHFDITLRVARRSRKP